MEDKIDFSDLRVEHAKNSEEIINCEKLERLSGDYGEEIIASKKGQLEILEQKLATINPKNIKDFELQSKDLISKIASLQKEISQAEELPKKREKLCKRNQEILIEAKERKDKLIAKVEEKYQKQEKEEKKQESEEVKKAKKELAGFEEQLSKIEEDEKNYPNKVKDPKWKKFLNTKIQENKEIIKRDEDKKSASETKKLLLNEINKEYLNFKKQVTKDYMPEEYKKPNPVFEKAKQKRGNTFNNDDKRKNKIPNDVKIEIGRKGKITYNGKEYKVGKDVIKKGVNLTSDQMAHIAELMELNVTPEVKTVLKECMDSNLIDPAVINTVYESEMDGEDKKNLTKQYILDVFNAKQGKEYKNNCNLTYQNEDISKANFFSRVFGKEISQNDKIKLVARSKKANRYNIAKVQGEYKPRWYSKIVSKITRKSVLLLPTAGDEQVVAEKYNKLRDELKVDNIDDDKYMKQLDMSQVQKEELQDLHKEQKDQEGRI